MLYYSSHAGLLHLYLGGPQSGDRGWSITHLEEADVWHGRPTGDTSDVWSMRLPDKYLSRMPMMLMVTTTL